jgi:hypothetical protein
MKPTDVAKRNLQRERNERGNDFQDEIRRSWAFVENCWRMRVKDGGGGTRPADEIVTLEEVNILAELKRTEGQKFELSFLRPDQISGLLDFDRVVTRNYGLVYVSFHNEKQQRDEAYAVRLATAIRYMQGRGVAYIHLDDFRRGALPSCKLPRMETAKPTYDLKGLVKCCKSL